MVHRASPNRETNIYVAKVPLSLREQISGNLLEFLLFTANSRYYAERVQS